MLRRLPHRGMERCSEALGSSTGHPFWVPRARPLLAGVAQLAERRQAVNLKGLASNSSIASHGRINRSSATHPEGSGFDPRRGLYTPQNRSCDSAVHGPVAQTAERPVLST